MRVARVAGIDFKVDRYFFLLFFLYITFGILPRGVIIFTVVFLHELAHVLTAVSYGLRVREVELFLFGGVAVLEDDLALEPAAELPIALAGPLASFFLAGLGLAMKKWEWGQEPLVSFFIEANLVLGAFNLLPFYPLDGGRILRSLLTERFGLQRGMEKAFFWGWVGGWGLVFAGLFSLLVLEKEEMGISMVLTGFFLLYAGRKERRQLLFSLWRAVVKKKSLLRKKRFLKARLYVVSGEMRLREALNLIPSGQYLLLVLPGTTEPVIITEEDLLMAGARLGLNSSLAELANLLKMQK
ncbi:MAG: stage sporulation protein [Eubacteriales bacterium]|nr:stage sporulation protein [Eubacteriales bacterium]